MNAQEFKDTNTKVINTIENIEQMLLTKFGENFSDWVYIYTIPFADRAIVPVVKDIYTNKGWDIEIRNECENYRNVDYIDNVYLRYKEDI